MIEKAGESEPKIAGFWEEQKRRENAAVSLPVKEIGFSRKQASENLSLNTNESGTESFLQSIESFDLAETGSDFFRFAKNDDDHDNCSETISLPCSSEEGNLSDTDTDSETTQSQVNDPPLYSGAPLSMSSSILLVLSFVQKHGLNGQAFADLLTIIKAHCPKPNNCTTMVKKLLDVLGSAKGDIVHHTYCAYCKGYVGKSVASRVTSQGNCQICGKDLAEWQGTFVEVLLFRQLQRFFNGKCRQKKRTCLGYDSIQGYQNNMLIVRIIHPDHQIV